jgi:hypothetical protein
MYVVFKCISVMSPAMRHISVMSPAMRLPNFGSQRRTYIKEKKKKKDFVRIYIKEVWFSSPKFLNF